MPTKKYKNYFKWGKTGAKYKFIPGNAESEKKAKAKADKQGKAIHSSGWREPKKLCSSCMKKQH